MQLVLLRVGETAALAEALERDQAAPLVQRRATARMLGTRQCREDAVEGTRHRVEDAAQLDIDRDPPLAPALGGLARRPAAADDDEARAVVVEHQISPEQ